jgi:hypothetical protein
MSTVHSCDAARILRVYPPMFSRIVGRAQLGQREAFQVDASPKRPRNHPIATSSARSAACMRLIAVGNWRSSAKA